MARRACLCSRSPPGAISSLSGIGGAPQQACENTLESFETALHLGANALELDLSLTRDQQVVVWHDWRPSLTSVLRPTGLCRLRHPLRPQPLQDVPLPEALRAYGYERDGHPVPLLTFTEFVQRVGPDARVRFVFLDLKIPEERPDLVSPLFQQAVQSLQHAHALAKAVFLTPYAPIFAQLRHEAQRWQQTTQTPVYIAFDTEGPEIPPGARLALGRRAKSAGRHALCPLGATGGDRPVVAGVCR